MLLAWLLSIRTQLHKVCSLGLFLNHKLSSFSLNKDCIMEPGWYKYFNYGTIIFIGILLIAILTDYVPLEWYIPLLILSIIIFILRIIFRIYITLRAKKKE